MRWVSLRIGCSRLAANQIGDAGVEALAHALLPSLTSLYLGSACGLGRSAVALGPNMRCGNFGKGRMWRMVLSSELAAADRLEEAMLQ
jgi:hypothetical protein